MEPSEEIPAFEVSCLLERWKVYFPCELKPERFDRESFQHLAAKIWFETFKNPENDKYLEYEVEQENNDRVVVYVNYSTLINCGDNNVTQLCSYVYENPGQIINTLGVALDCVRYYVKKIPKRKEIKPRFTNYNKLFPLSSVKAQCLGHFICIKGTVLRISTIKVLVKSIIFTCNDCKQKISMDLLDGVWNTPNSCTNMDCRSRFFIPDKVGAKTSFYQRLRLQEIENDIKDLNAGKMPKCMDVEIRDDLIDKCISGDVVTIAGILKTEIMNDFKSRGARAGNRTTGLHTSYLDANSIMNSNINTMGSTNCESVDQRDVANFLSLAERGDELFPLFVKSACPSIYGNELVKAGLVLSLFGGTDLRFKKQQFSDLNNNDNLAQMDDEEDVEDVSLAMRPDIHVLMIGDPGMGKSQMLKHINCVAPRGVYVCGNSTTNAGLTATLIRDGGSNEQNLEAGALVLSDLGVCCIDEFDKMSGDQSALLEAMEQQTISIAKGGIIGSLSARCTLMACANPVSGHYQRSRSIIDNIRISNAILSRFDLIFLMLDEPDLDKDRLLSEHIMKLHARKGKRRQDDSNGYSQMSSSGMGYGSESGYNTSSYEDPYPRKRSYNTHGDRSNIYGASDTDIDGGIRPEEDYETLVNYLKRVMHQMDEDQILTPEFIKKYVTFAKRTCFPKLSKEACEILKSFYISLRVNSSGHNSIPVTSRQLDSIIRLSQAKAKLELRSIVTREDAEIVVKLIQESLFETNYDLVGFKATIDKIAGKKKVDKGEVDVNNIGSLSQPKQTKIFIEKLKEIATEKQDKSFTHTHLMEISRSLNMQVGDFRQYIDKLNANNVLLMKGHKIYELCVGL
ncbi:unnamed protein product [Moneuplotes crassus]|uniref:DNA helicase n=1 Tax=Euplotes crassus TaxID=5936 RepID=A0AAD2D9F7_EUPCR|nr:unnamed protein product [Moneuplotes crassus]